MAKRIERIDIAQNDVFEGIKESAKKAEMEVDLLAKALKLVTQEIDDIKGKAKGMKLNPIPTDVKGIKDQNQMQKDALSLAKKREELDKYSLLTKSQMQKAEQDLQKQRERSIAQLEKEAKKSQEANRPYNKLSATLNELRGKYKDLAVAGNENSTEARKMKREIDSLDKTLKRVDGNVGQFQRNVGNYSSAFGKLSGALSTLGIGFGVGAVFSGVKNFTVEMQQLNLQASRLGVSSENLKGFVSEAKSLGQTFGTEVNDNMVAVNTLIKEFGISQEQAFKLLENGYLSGANAQGDMLDSIKEYSSQVKASGGDANTLINILNRSGKEGIFSDKGVDVVKEFGLRIREQTSATSDALRNAFGDEFTDRIFNGINDGSMTSVQALEEVSKKMNDATIPTNKLQTVIADTFGGAGEDAGLRFIQTLTDIGSATGDVVDKTDPYVKQQLEMKRLNDELVEAQQSLYESLGGTGANIEQLTLKAKVLFFQNILPAIKIVAKLTAGFIAFKTVTAIANTDFKALISNFTKFKTEAGEGTSKMSGFGNALKGIGWSVAIGLAIELGMKLYDIASGAEAARDAMRKYEAQLKTSNEASQGKINELQEREKQRIAELNELLKDKRISQAQYVKLVEQAKNTTESELRNNKKLANDRKQRFKDLKAELLELREKAELEKGSQKGSEAFIKLQSRASEIAKELNISGNKTYGILSSDADDIQVLAQLEANIGGINKRLVNYSQALKDISDSEKDFIDKTKDSTITTNAKTKAIEKQTKAVTELQDKVKRSRDTEIEFQNLENETLNDQIQSAQEQQLNNIADAGTYTIDVLNELIAKQKELRLAMINSEFADNVAGGMNLDLAEAKRNKAIQDLDEETLKSRKTMLRELETAQEEFWERDRLGNKSKNEKDLEDEKKALDERRNMRKEFVDGVIDEMKRISTEEEKLIDDRIKAEQDLQSNLQAQANAGNISAQQSIVASMEAEKRATLEKQKEQRKQQALDDIKTLYNLINSNISSGDGVGIATTKAIASMGVIKSVAKVFSALTGFAKGTEWRLGDEHKPMFGGVDGHVVRVDSSEAIVKGSLMDKAERAGITSTSELVQLAVSQKLQPNMYAMNDDRLNYVPVSVKQNNDLSELKRELRDIKDTIKNKTEFSIDPYVLNGMVKGIVETQKTGNFSRKNIFK
jgi:myosin heavy subunit